MPHYLDIAAGVTAATMVLVVAAAAAAGGFDERRRHRLIVVFVVVVVPDRQAPANRVLHMERRQHLVDGAYCTRLHERVVVRSYWPPSPPCGGGDC